MIFRRQFRSGKVALKLVAGIAGAAFLGPMAGVLLGSASAGTALGFIIGSAIGNFLFPTESNVSMPKISNYPIQTATKGIPVQVVYGDRKVAGNILWMDKLQVIIHEEENGGKGGGGGITTTTTTYKRSFLIGVCEGPGEIFQVWAGKKKLDLDEHDITFFEGSNNTTISTVIGREFARYKHLCCVYFEDFDLGTTDRIPNFNFEVHTWQYPDTTGFTEVSTVQDLIDIGLDQDGNYVLVNDIDASGASWVAIGSSISKFRGKLYGDGYTIDGLNFSRILIGDQFEGLFAYLDGADIRDFKLTNVDMSLYGRLGAVAGQAENSSSLYNIDVSGTLACKAVLGGITGGLRSGSVISHCVNDCDFTDNAASAGPTYRGGICGSSDDDCSITYCKNTGTIGAVDETTGPQGGIDGRSYAYLSHCINHGDVLSANNACGGIAYRRTYADPKMEKCYVAPAKSSETVTVHAGNWAGGLVAAARSTALIENCYSEAIVIGKVGANYAGGAIGYIEDAGVEFKNCYSIGPVTGNTIGGFCGYDDSIGATFTGCFWDKTTSGTDVSDGGTGKTTAQMWDRETYTAVAWDMIGIWRIRDELDYPKLRTPVGITIPEMVFDLLTNTRYGAGVDSDYINSSTFVTEQSYFEGIGYVFCIVIGQQRPVVDWIDYMNSHCRGYIFMSEGKINYGSFKDESAVVNLTQDDLVKQRGENPPPPIDVKKREYRNTANRIEMTWTSRENNYDISVAVANDEVDQQISGIRIERIQLDGIVSPGLAIEIAYRLLFESLYRFGYFTFILGYKNMLLEPGDVISLTDGFSLNNERARILEISEHKDGKNLVMRAVEDKAFHYGNIDDYVTAEGEHDDDDDIVSDDLLSPNVYIVEDPAEHCFYFFFVPQNEYASGFAIYQSVDDSNFTLLGYSLHKNVDGGLTTSLPAAESLIRKPDQSFTLTIDEWLSLSTVSEEEFLGNKQIAMIRDKFAIDVANTGGDYFRFNDDLSEDFAELYPDDTVTVTGSTGNDGVWTIDHITYSGGVTYVYVVEDITSSTADGYLWFGEETIAFREAVDNGDGTYTLTDLIRGLYYTTPKAHAVGSLFFTMSIPSYKVGSTDAGVTQYFKILTFYDTAIQQLEDVDSISFTPLNMAGMASHPAVLQVEDSPGLPYYSGADVVVTFEGRSTRQVEYNQLMSPGYNAYGLGTTRWLHDIVVDYEIIKIERYRTSTGAYIDEVVYQNLVATPSEPGWVATGLAVDSSGVYSIEITPTYSDETVVVSTYNGSHIKPLKKERLEITGV